MTEAATRIAEALKGVCDPCCRERGISIVDMGLVRSVEVEGGRVKVELMLTSGWCPFASRVLSEVRDVVGALPGVGEVSVEVKWDQPWSMERLSESARAKLRFLPDPVRVPDRARYVEAHSTAPRATPDKGGRAT